MTKKFYIWKEIWNTPVCTVTDIELASVVWFDWLRAEAIRIFKPVDHKQKVAVKKKKIERKKVLKNNPLSIQCVYPVTYPSSSPFKFSPFFNSRTNFYRILNLLLLPSFLFNLSSTIQKSVLKNAWSRLPSKCFIWIIYYKHNYPYITYLRTNIMGLCAFIATKI